MIKRKSSKKVIEEEKLFSRNPNENVYLLEINETGQVDIPDDQFLRLANFSQLIFRLYNGSPISKNCCLLTNYDTDLDVFENLKPLKKGDDISHLNKHHHIKIDTSIEFSLDLIQSGGYFFQFCFEEDNSTLNFTPEIWIVIDPYYKMNKRSLNLSSISMQTVLSKSLGKIDDWEEYYKEASSLNYNFVHYTPIQPTGGSESLYCLRDQTDINDDFFPSIGNEKPNKQQKYDIFEEKIMNFQLKYNLLGIVDIVLNHTSTDSQWLYDNPDSGYNLVNSPHLTSAFHLDELILNYSNRYANKKVLCTAAPYINNDNDLDRLIEELSDEIKKLRLEEYFLINITENENKMKILYEELKGITSKQIKEKKKVVEELYKESQKQVIFDFIHENCTSNYGASRNGVIVNCYFIALLLFKPAKSEKLFLKDFSKHANKINEIWKEKALNFIYEAIRSVRGTIHYEFIQCKNFKVTEKKRLCENYFSPWNGDSSDSSRVFANNGWLFGSDNPTLNFASYGNWDYLRRSIVIWGDCAKLRYGDKPSDSEFLWKHMSKYVEKMAICFNGFRLDNAHSTPIHVAQYLINLARKINPHLLIIAELFAGTKEKEIEFVKKIGINLLIREMIWCGNAGEIGTKLHRYGGGKDHVLGKIDEKCQLHRLNKLNNSLELIEYKQLVGQYPSSIIFDITHDNITLYDKTGSLALNLPMIANVGASLSAVATTRGFDQLFFYQPSVVRESRQYKYESLESDIIEEQELNSNLYSDKLVSDFDQGMDWKEEEINGADKENLQLENDSVKEQDNKHTTKVVLFEYTNSTANSVTIVISQSKSTTHYKMSKTGNKFIKTINLSIGLHYYKYILDDINWVHDPSKEVFKDKAGLLFNIVRVEVSPYPIINTYNDLKIVRKEINLMRKISALRNNEYYLHMDHDIIVIFRLFHDLNSSDNYNGYVLISRPIYDKYNKTGIATKVELPGLISGLVFIAEINMPDFDANSIKSNKDFLLGTKGNIEFIKNIDHLHKIAKITRLKNKEIIEFKNFKPNMVVLLKVNHSEETKNSLINIRSLISEISSLKNENKLSITDINHILYSCEKEELFLTNGKRGVYDVPNMGKLVYAGISHINKIINRIKVSQELGHPIFNNIRIGDWLLGFYFDRIKEANSASDVYKILQVILKYYSNLPNYLKPHYSCKILDILFNHFKRAVIQSAKVILASSSFTQDLLMASFQFLSNVPKCQIKSNISMAAGLPHFSTEYMRCWGRDTFISLRGLLLIPGYFKEAKSILLEFASCLRHGLIPNLLDQGINPRYNARDATWFFIQSVQDYMLKSDEGEEFLKEEVEMQFLDDDQETHLKKKEMNEIKKISISDIIHKIFQEHANGINFREWNAGKQIDEHMSNEGFNVSVTLNEETGYIIGGNKFNCGTWMDKMGSSLKAKNKGVPATSRDGANVELIGLLFSNLKYFNSLFQKKKYPYNQVTLRNGNHLTFIDWMVKLKDNFEKHFWIEKKNEINNKTNIEGSSIFIEEIYKDVVNSSNHSSENQFRPNFIIAMALAPDLFTPSRALIALKNVEKHLLVENGLGIRTLSQNDPLYCGNYENDNDSNDFDTAHGFNYHNGPEWVWPLGYYIRAKINFCKNDEDLKRSICKVFIPHMKTISSNDWSGLPELTNSNNSPCPGSCNTQAWSVATILEGFCELFKLDN